MQPKPIEARHLLDIDASNRLLGYEGVQYLRGVREQKEHPAETDYDVIHDEANRRHRQESSKHMAEQMRKTREEQAQQAGQSQNNPPEDKKDIPEEEKGSHLDIEA